MYDTILFPTDGSHGAEAALEYATEHARQYDAELHALYVAETAFELAGVVGKDHGGDTSPMVGEHRDSDTSPMIGDADERLDALLEAGRVIVAEVADAVGNTVSVTTAVREGRPYQTILEYADTEDIDLIVMGTHGRTGVERYLLGSVTEKVVRTAEVPVLTVRLGG